VQKSKQISSNGLSRPSSASPETPFVLSCTFFRVPMSWAYMGPGKILRGSWDDGPVAQFHFEILGIF
jgi:hypothetical protein